MTWLSAHHPTPDPARPGQESVWDFPRPAIAQPSDAHLRVLFAGQVVVDTRRAVRTIETSHPPTWYMPVADFADGVLRPAAGSSFCEWKGMAVYHDIVVGDRIARRCGWSYPDPSPSFAMIRNHVALYAAAMDACFVDEEPVTPQPGGFYGGWITSRYAGPFKGVPGSNGW